MKAIVCTNYGSPDVLKLQQIKKPIPKDNEVLIKIHATTVTSGDCRVRSFKSPLLYKIPMRLFLGIRRPRNPILGTELSGVIEAVGTGVKGFKNGDPIYAFTGMKFGGYAEYICLAADSTVTIKPTNTTHEEAASILFGGTTALYFLRKGKIQSGQKILIYGASGATGTSAVQLAKYFGAEVTGVCSTGNMELVKSLGADDVIDYTKEDWAASGKRYDIIFDAVGKTSKSKCKNVLLPDGVYVTVEGQGIAKVRLEDLIFLKELVEAGAVKSVIDSIYPFEQTPEAHRYVEKGHKKGNVVISVILLSKISEAL
ncbi:NAD(P)-dependent alcohol dehydrogenase [Paenibacillus luteus]|uniref:NAD(P)-dependent alcohol dehydrogenase n=1 Tax=Paenibacillus luteus TaxID=2545753 RepID=UPI0011412D85|nr:NAD(P)-dependent alcohol dehydrogenase [Paenibacillus luteus]